MGIDDLLKSQGLREYWGTNCGKYFGVEFIGGLNFVPVPFTLFQLSQILAHLSYKHARNSLPTGAKVATRVRTKTNVFSFHITSMIMTAIADIFSTLFEKGEKNRPSQKFRV